MLDPIPAERRLKSALDALTRRRMGAMPYHSDQELDAAAAVGPENVDDAAAWFDRGVPREGRGLVESE